MVTRNHEYSKVTVYATCQGANMIGGIASIAMLTVGILMVLRMTVSALKATGKPDECPLQQGLEDDVVHWPVRAAGWTALDELQLVRLLEEE